MAVVPLYATSIHKTVASGDIRKMKALKKQAEKWLKEHGNVSGAVEILKQEIAKLEART